MIIFKILQSVLLGIRASYKEDLKASSAEALYSKNLHFPGKILNKKETASEFLNCLRHTIQSFQPQKGFV